MAEKTVISTISISTEGKPGAGKTRTIDGIISQLAYMGAIQSLTRNDDRHTATVVLKHTIFEEEAATLSKGAM